MEEKERYELTDTDCILDTERNIVVSDVCDVVANADIITDLLNQQDKRIKELENKHLLSESEYQSYCAFKTIEPEIKGCLDREKNLENENKQLKQQLHDLPKKIVEDVRIKAKENIFVCSKNATEEDINYAIIYNSCLLDVRYILDTILKKYTKDR